MVTVDFTPLEATAGGVLIGLGATLLLLGTGRAAGISGIFGGLVLPRAGDLGWRVAFLGGLLAGGLAVALAAPHAIANAPGVHAELTVVAIAGVLVGFGTRMGNGCTSGHGVCGIARLSRRSIVATMTFMATAGLTVFVVRHVLGGAP